MERLSAASTVAIDRHRRGRGRQAGFRRRGEGHPARVVRNLAKGTAFTRYAMALAASKGNLVQAAETAKQWKESTPEVERVLKAAVAAGTTTDSAWASPLVDYRMMAEEFIELLRTRRRSWAAWPASATCRSTCASRGRPAARPSAGSVKATRSP
jgi:hypothetical protein